MKIGLESKNSNWINTDILSNFATETVEQHEKIDESNVKINQVQLSPQDQKDFERLFKTQLQDLENLLNTINERTKRGPFDWISSLPAKILLKELEKRGYIFHFSAKLEIIGEHIVENKNKFSIFVTEDDVNKEE